MALFIGTVAVAVACAFLIPKINVNTDMTSYLPESYSMKQGMTIMDEEFTGLQEQAGEYSLSFSEGIDALPKGLGKTIIIGIAMVFVVLLIMCSSVLEVVLFLITIGVAVLINTGTNALLPSVSQTTNMISPVLQMVLSMDYCIIMMNRFRDERVLGKDPVIAMNRAVGGTSGPIFSSAFTTIVSLLMLCFIKLKIGADLGIVLAKGVFISLVCTFTLLPALIIWCRKAIEASRKKPIRTMSKGMKRQAALILAIASQPDILLIDETFDGLDVIKRHDMKEILCGAVADRGLTVLLATHSMREVDDMCDTIAMLHKGRITLQSELDEAKTALCKVQIAFPEAFEKDAVAFDGASIVDFSRDGTVATVIFENDREQVERELKAKNPLLMNVLPLSLEEVFIYKNR